MRKPLLVIRSQYGDDSIALIQWAFEAGLSNLQVAYVDTGFGAAAFEAQISAGEALTRRCGYTPVRIPSKINFEAAVMGRGAFPSTKFQWCAGMLKGLPFLEWLDSIDLRTEAIVLIPKRRFATTEPLDLPERIEACPYHGDRTVWHPLVEVHDEERDALLARAGFRPLGHRSLECEPCVNSSATDLRRLGARELERVKALELELGQGMSFTLEDEEGEAQELIGIETAVRWSRERVSDAEADKNRKTKNLDNFYRGCGNHFGCGL